MTRKTAKYSRPTARVDIHAVAKRANVSIATVSRTVNGISTVNAAYSDRVWAAVHDLGYVPNTQARALVSGRSRLIGIIISDITNPFFPELIQSFEEEAIDANYEIQIGSTAYDSSRMEICIDRMLQRKVDGVAVMTFGIETPLLDRLAAHNIPLVFIDIAPKGKATTAIKIDYVTGLCEAVGHLAGLGHRKIAFIAGPKGLHSADSRRQAFLDAMKQSRIKSRESYIYVGDHKLEGGMAGMRFFLEQVDRPTAVICSNDMMAIGVLHVAADAKLSVPRDLSVIGFDDIHMARFIVPPLTTIRMSCQEIARTAFSALRSYLEEGSTLPAKYLRVGTSLTVRQSTGVPKGSNHPKKRRPRG